APRALTGGARAPRLGAYRRLVGRRRAVRARSGVAQRGIAQLGALQLGALQLGVVELELRGLVVRRALEVGEGLARARRGQHQAGGEAPEHGEATRAERYRRR